MNTVAQLKKITLLFEAGISPDNMNFEMYSPEFTFVFGLAAEGMTPFEYQLAGKSEGDGIAFSLDKADIGPFFGHLHVPLSGGVEVQSVVFTRVTILAVRDADNREILKAMSEMVAHGSGGCGGGCGCGCG